MEGEGDGGSWALNRGKAANLGWPLSVLLCLRASMKAEGLAHAPYGFLHVVITDVTGFKQLLGQG